MRTTPLPSKPGAWLAESTAQLESPVVPGAVTGARAPHDARPNQDAPVFVTRPHLPELSEFVKYLERIWSTHILTNDGPLHQELEQALVRYLGVEHVSLFSNATVALMTALRALDVSGEVITTPFSFVASTHAITWCGLTPVFSDIEPETYTLDPERIESCITPRTKALLPVHVYGYPCRVAQIERIAKRHALRVVYDAAHAFGVRYQGESLLAHGDVSVLSFHATKIFNTFEGGAAISRDRETKERIDLLRNHGIRDELTVVAPGLNGKLNEVQAAMGLLQFKDIDARIAKGEAISRAYRAALGQCAGIRLLSDLPDVRHNYSYLPILVDDTVFGADRDCVYERLEAHRVFARRYFYPLISDMPAYRELPSANASRLPVAQAVSRQVLCLPTYAALDLGVIDEVCRIVVSVAASAPGPSQNRLHFALD